MDWTCFSQHIPQMLVWIGIWRPSEHLVVVALLKPFLKPFCTVVKEATALREYRFHEEVHL